ncbi:MAG: DUF481 domain-containing protein [Bacteroidetes bacterium]|nr:DUF481 domain-containing protein [Bacteroidota bacterium]
MKKLLLLFTFFILCAAYSHAQILTIDQTDTSDYKHKTVTQGELSIALEGDKQQKLLLDATNTFNYQLQNYKNLLIFSSSYRFTYNGGQDFLNAGHLHLRWRHDYKNTWQPESFVQYQWDGARGMVRRFLAGENVRYGVWHKHEWELSAASGLMYETETWNFTAVDSALKPIIQNQQVTELLKSNNYVKIEGKLSPNTIFSFINFYQTPFNDLFRAFRLASSIRFEVGAGKHFDFTMAFSSLYDSKPVVPITKFYYSFSNGIAYKF